MTSCYGPASWNMQNALAKRLNLEDQCSHLHGANAESLLTGVVRVLWHAQ